MTAPKRKGTKVNKKQPCMSTFVRGAVMIWSAGMLTAHYAGVVKNMDATFIAGLFTSTLATFGVTSAKKEDDENTTTARKKLASSAPKSSPQIP